MICKYCGADNPLDARVCGACGRAIDSPAPFSDSDPVPGAGKPRRSGRGGRIVLIVLAVLALAAGVVFRRTVAETFIRAFSSPEAYYHHVERRAIDDFAGRAGDAYAAVFGADGRGKSRALRTEISPVLEDMDWLKTLTLTSKTHTDGGALRSDAALTVNGKDILSASLYNDAEITALNVPVLSKDDLKLESDFAAALGALRAAGLSRAEVETLIRTLLTDASEQIHDVARSRASLTAGEISQRCTLLTVTMDKKDAEAIRASLADTLRHSSAAKKLLAVLSEATGKEQDALVEALTGAVLNSVTDGDNAEMRLYVGADGSVRGRDLALPDESGLHFALPSALLKGAARLECSVQTPDGDVYALAGTLRAGGGTIRATAKLDGREQRLLTLDYSDLTLKKDARAASFTLMCERGLAGHMGSTFAARLAENLSAAGSFSQRGDTLRCEYDLALDGERLAAVRTEQTPLDDADIQPPTDALPRLAWLRTVRVLPAIGELTKALKDAGMPADILRTLLSQLAEQVFGSAA